MSHRCEGRFWLKKIYTVILHGCFHKSYSYYIWACFLFFLFIVCSDGKCRALTKPGSSFSSQTATQTFLQLLYKITSNCLQNWIKTAPMCLQHLSFLIHVDTTQHGATQYMQLRQRKIENKTEKKHSSSQTNTLLVSSISSSVCFQSHFGYIRGFFKHRCPYLIILFSLLY